MDLKTYVRTALEAVGGGARDATLTAAQDEQIISVEFEVATSAGGANYHDLMVEHPDSANKIGMLKFSVRVAVAGKPPTG